MPSAERIALVERLVRENKSNKEIAEILGIKQSSVRSTTTRQGRYGARDGLAVATLRW